MAATPPITDWKRPRTRPPGPLAEQILDLAGVFARSQHQLVVVAAEFADSSEWVIAGSPNAARWLADASDIEVATAREWIRVGRRLRELPHLARAFDTGTLSYSKVRTLTRVATHDNDAELTDGAETIDTEVVLHVRGDGATCDDGTPIPDTVIDELELRCAPCHRYRHRRQAA